MHGGLGCRALVGCPSRRTVTKPLYTCKVFKRLIILLISGASALSAQSNWAIFGSPPISGNEPAYARSKSDFPHEYLAFNTSSLFIKRHGDSAFQPLVFETPYGFYGDPVLLPALDGGMYLAHLARNPDADWPDFFNRMVVEKFNVQGQHEFSVATPVHGSKMQDKPWITLNELVESPERGALYLTWTEFDDYGSDAPGDSSRICFARLAPGAKVFDELVVVSDRCGNAMDDDGTAEGATVGVLPTGELLCIWAKEGQIWQDRSLDFGKSWGRDTAIAQQLGGWNHDGLEGCMRANGMPFLAIGPKGQIAVVYTQGGLQERRLVGLWSRDGGYSYEQFEWEVDGETFAPQIVWPAEMRYPQVLVHSTQGFYTHRFYHMWTLKMGPRSFSKAKILSPEPTLLPGDSYFMGDYASWQFDGSQFLAAYTHFYMPKSRPCIATMSWTAKELKKGAASAQYPIFRVHQEPGSEYLYAYVNWPGRNSCTLELEQGGRKWQQVVEELPPGGMDIRWPCSSMDSGPALLRLRSGGNYITENLQIRR